jgi:hypothetical protein
MSGKAFVFWVIVVVLVLGYFQAYVIEPDKVAEDAPYAISDDTGCIVFGKVTPEQATQMCDDAYVPSAPPTAEQQQGRQSRTGCTAPAVGNEPPPDDPAAWTCPND